MSETAQQERIPSTAVKLSSLCAGLGHIYCGRFTFGLVLYFLSLLLAPVVVAAILSGIPTVIIWGILLPCLLVIVLWVYTMISSYRLAKKIGKNYELKDYNNATVYAIFSISSIFFTATVVVLAAFYVRANVLEAFSCPGESMSPTILQGDRFLVNKLLQRKQPSRGDIIVFLSPENRDQRFVKRVIGLPGDTIAVQGKDVFLNGKKLEHQPASASDHVSDSKNEEIIMRESIGETGYRIQFVEETKKIADYPETKIPSGNCFVLGDNRNNSHDSRKFGFVPLGDILGKAEYLYFPASNWSRFGALNN